MALQRGWAANACDPVQRAAGGCGKTACAICDAGTSWKRRCCAAMEWESNGRIWERQQSERVERAAGRKVRLAEGVRSVFVQRLQGMPLTEAFTAMDQNGDGVLSVDEFKRGLRALKIGLMPWEVGEFVSLVDSDLSGSISKAEFIDMFSRPLMTGGPHAPVAATGVPKNGTDDAVPLPGATRGSRPRAVVDREMTARLDALEELSAAVIDPDEYGTHSRADAIDAEARVLVRPDTSSMHTSICQYRC